MDKEQDFGKVIRELRTKAKLSQQKLADWAKIERESLNRIENGHYSPSLRTAFGISAALKVNLSDLIKKLEKRNKSR